MMTLSDAAVETISTLCREEHHGSRSVRIRSISAGTLPTVALEHDAVHHDRDVTVSRGGVTVFVDRELAAATADKVLDAEPHPADTGQPIFLLHDQPDTPAGPV
jgi:Fe-S cluster assembly iron-binding protein IscA